MPDMTVIRSLPALQWRGLDAPPYDVVTAEFQHEQAPRRVPYVNGEMHNWTGRKSFVFTARLYFLNGLIDEPDHFPGTWEDGGWKDALLDGSSDTLIHPVLGPILARVMGGKFEIRATVTSGIIVDVTWTEDLDDPAGPQGFIAPTVDPTQLASAADKGAAKFGVAVPDTFGFNSLSSAWTASKLGLFAVSITTQGGIEKIIGATESMIDELDVLDDSTAWPAREACVQFWISLREISDRVAAANRPTAKRIIFEKTTLDAFAPTVKNTLTDIMGLNLKLLRLPYVPRGSTITYYVNS